MVVPIAIATVLVVGALAWWTNQQAKDDLRSESSSSAGSAFLELERLIRASGGSAPSALAAMSLDDEILDAVVVAGTNGEVVASTNLRDRYQVLDTLTDREVVSDLAEARNNVRSEPVVEHGSANGDPDVVHVYGRLRTSVDVSTGTDYDSATAHLTIDVSATRAAIAQRARVQRVASLLASLTVAFVALFALRLGATRRLRRLADDVAGVAAGEVEFDASRYGEDQIGRVAVELGAAFQTIADRGRQLAETNAWLEDEMSRRQDAEAETRHQARHDALTGLANRIAATDVATTLIGQTDWTQDRRPACLHVNLDRFKTVNESLGYEVGDRVLREQARRLLMAVGSDDLVARINGDEFLVLLVARREGEISSLAAALIATLEVPIQLGNGTDVFGSASIGAATAQVGDAPAALFRRAGMALTRAKEAGRATYAWFDEAMQAAIEARAELAVALRYAIEDARPGDTELELHYQPIVDLAEGTIRGFESLVRWRRSGTLIPPSDFIELAEDTGLIVPLGAWIMKEALAQAGRWQQLFADRPPVVTVNVSGHQLSAGGVPALIRASLTANRVDPRYITVELTESVLLDDVRGAVGILDEIKALGVKLAADDFGTGYSSLTYLRQFPFDVVKVDQSFVRHLGDDAQDSTIVAAVIAMARALGLRVVCEGVETREQLAGLMTLGADDGQGWYFSKALPAAEATEVFAAGLASLAPAFED